MYPLRARSLRLFVFFFSPCQTLIIVDQELDSSIALGLYQVNKWKLNFLSDKVKKKVQARGSFGRWFPVYFRDEKYVEL